MLRFHQDATTSILEYKYRQPEKQPSTAGVTLEAVNDWLFGQDDPVVLIRPSPPTSAATPLPPVPIPISKQEKKKKQEDGRNTTAIWGESPHVPGTVNDFVCPYWAAKLYAWISQRVHNKFQQFESRNHQEQADIETFSPIWILEGPHGSGKTLFAQLVAKRFQFQVHSFSMAEYSSSYDSPVVWDSILFKTEPSRTCVILDDWYVSQENLNPVLLDSVRTLITKISHWLSPPMTPAKQNKLKTCCPIVFIVEELWSSRFLHATVKPLASKRFRMKRTLDDAEMQRVLYRMLGQVKSKLDFYRHKDMIRHLIGIAGGNPSFLVHQAQFESLLASVSSTSSALLMDKPTDTIFTWQERILFQVTSSPSASFGCEQALACERFNRDHVLTPNQLIYALHENSYNGWIPVINNPIFQEFKIPWDVLNRFALFCHDNPEKPLSVAIEKQGNSVLSQLWQKESKKKAYRDALEEEALSLERTSQISDLFSEWNSVEKENPNNHEYGLYFFWNLHRLAVTRKPFGEAMTFRQSSLGKMNTLVINHHKTLQTSFPCRQSRVVEEYIYRPLPSSSPDKKLTNEQDKQWNEMPCPWMTLSSSSTQQEKETENPNPKPVKQGTKRKVVQQKKNIHTGKKKNTKRKK